MESEDIILVNPDEFVSCKKNTTYTSCAKLISKIEELIKNNSCFQEELLGHGAPASATTTHPEPRRHHHYHAPHGHRGTGMADHVVSLGRPKIFEGETDVSNREIHGLINKVTSANSERLLRRVMRSTDTSQGARIIEFALSRACEEHLRTDVYIAFAMRTMNICGAHTQIMSILQTLEERITTDMQAFVNLDNIDTIAYNGFCDYVKLKARIKGAVAVVLKVSDHLGRDSTHILSEITAVTRVNCTNVKFVEILVDTMATMVGIATSLSPTTHDSVMSCSKCILMEFKDTFEVCANKKTLFRLRDLSDVCCH